jgi:hypothetical protein
MKPRVLLSAVGIALLSASSSFAQQKPGVVAALEFQTPKNGMVKQYEDGRKQKAAWHKEQKDPQPLLVWQIQSGDSTGTYIVGRLDQHWADFDKPAISDAADLEAYNKLVGASVQSIVTRYYEYLPKVSAPPDSPGPAKFAEIVTFHVRPGKAGDFRSALERANEAMVKTKWGVKALWYSLVSGGSTGTFVLVLPHATWADFEDKPDTKPFSEMLKDAFGASEAESLTNRFDSAIDAETSEIIEFRPDLSYLPSK